MAEPFECGLWEDGCGGVAPWCVGRGKAYAAAGVGARASSPASVPVAPLCLALQPHLTFPAHPSPSLLPSSRMTLSLLGPSLHTLNQQRRAAVVDHLPAYARGMLAAVEGLHRHGVGIGEGRGG